MRKPKLGRERETLLAPSYSSHLKQCTRFRNKGATLDVLALADPQEEPHSRAQPELQKLEN